MKINLTERTRALTDFDNIIRQELLGLPQGSPQGFLCGVDEAGRGPAAGPVVAAAAVFSDDVFIEGVFDSKKVTHAKREDLYEEIISSAVCYGVGIINSGEIDSINILNATKKAMTTAVSKLSTVPVVIIADGNFYSHHEVEVRNVIKADEKSFSVAAASIIAKVTRDRIMCRYQEQYPQFSFSTHKGYCTALHMDEIMEHGYTEIHRRSFKLKAIQQEMF